MEKGCVCVVGATGNVGQAAVRAFHTAGWEVRLLRRSSGWSPPEKEALFAEFSGLGAEIREVVDLVTDPAALQAALCGADVVISCTSFTVPATDQRALLNAAVAAGVRRFVPSEYGLDYDRVRLIAEKNEFTQWAEAKWLFREELRATTAIEHTIVCAGLMPDFMFAGAIFAGEVMPALVPSDAAEAVIPWTTATAVGALLPAIVARPEAKNGTIVVAGTDMCTWKSAVKKCAAGRGVESIPSISIEMDELRHMHDATDDHVLKHVFGLLATVAAGVADGIDVFGTNRGVVETDGRNGLDQWAAGLSHPPRINDDTFLKMNDEGASWQGPAPPSEGARQGPT